MSTTVKAAPSPPAAAPTDGYRVTIRHTPFRLKSRVFDVATEAEAWAAFLALLHAEHQALTEPQKKSFGRQQAEWLAERDAPGGARPAHCEIIPEAQFQRRLHAARDREEQSRRLLEQGQRAQQAQTEQLAVLIAQLPEQLGKAVGQALAARGGKQS